VPKKSVGRADSVCFTAVIQSQGNMCNHKLMDAHTGEGVGKGVINATPGIASGEV
jgi:hypothetical protein